VTSTSLTTGREVEVAYAWLESVLEPDAALNALHPKDNLPANADGVPAGVVYPVATWNLQADAAGDAYAGGARGMYYVGLYQIKALTEEWGIDLAARVYARMHVLVQGASNVVIAVGSGATAINGEMLWCVRRGTFSYPEVDEAGRRFRHHGGMYEIATRSV
jgi:hypothetical protein